MKKANGDRLPGNLGKIEELCGREAALKLAAVFGGSYLYIPSGARWQLRARDQAIREEYDGGSTSANDLARKYGLSERQVFGILKGE